MADSKKIVAMEADGTRPWYGINRRLLPVKGIYFFFIAAIGALMPFIPVHMKQLGFTSTETGIIIGVMTFISSFVQPVFGAIADKTRRHKLVLIVCLISTGIFFGLLLVTPGRRGICVDIIIGCEGERTSILDHQCVLNLANKTDIHDSHLLSSIKNYDQIQEYNRNQLCTVSCNTSNSFSHSDLQNLCVSTKSSFEDCPTLSNGSENRNSTNKVYVQNTNEGRFIRYDSPELKKSCQLSSLKDINSRNMICKSYTISGCKLECYNGCHSDKTLNKKTFWIFSVLFLLANIFFAPITSLIDAIAYNILGEKRKLWGKQRLWGTIGFACFGMACTFIMDIVKTTEYFISFYTFIGLCVSSAIVATRLDVSKGFMCKKMLKNVSVLLRFPKLVAFMLTMTCIGTLHFALLGFLFWFLEDIGSNPIILGLCLVINSVSEIVMLFSAGYIVKVIGHIPCLYLSLIAYVVRYLGYSFLTSAWYVLPMEMLHGLCFGQMYAAASAYASIISPKGMSATVQGITAGLYFGLGKGISGLLTGKLFDSSSGLGERWTFRFYSFMALFVLIFYAFFNTVVMRKTTKAINKENDVKMKLQPEAEVEP